MATLDPQSLLNLYTGSLNGTPAGFTMAQNALGRGQLLEDYAVQQPRLQEDLGFALSDMANNQAARGAFLSGATQRKGERLGTQFGRAQGDLARGQAFGLAKLGLADIGASIPGVTF